jgi:DNA-binding response OmpR family regulator
LAYDDLFSVGPFNSTRFFSKPLSELLMPKETILIVDDDTELLDLLEFILSQYRIVKARDGREGLTAVRQHTPDLILLDMSMPRMSGMSMLEALRQTGCQTPVIFMTASSSELVAIQALRLGVTDYLTKPFDGAVLRQTIHKSLEKQRLSRKRERLSQAAAAAETVRQTIITLTHIINNQLTIIDGGLTLLQEQLHEPETTPTISSLEIIRDSHQSVQYITRVLDTLQQITKVDLTTYHADEHMLDIQALLHQTEQGNSLLL